MAKLIDAAAVLLLWRVAHGRASEQERQAVALFPSLLHIPVHVHLPVTQPGRLNSVVGTWSRDNLLDYFAAGPGGACAAAPAARASWSAAVGTEAAFPVPLPTMAWYTREAGRAFAFVPAERELFEPDPEYLMRAATWYRREGLRPGADDRAREGMLSAARIAELWLDSVRAGALERLDAFELETRLRRIGMAGADTFAQCLGWSHGLIGLDAVRAFNRHLAAWVAATLMPEPFRIGLVDRCVAHPGLCAILLAASASAANLARAAAERAAAPRTLPIRGVKYAGPAGGDPPTDTTVQRLIKPLHGVPVFSPLVGDVSGLWEVFIPLRVERLMRPEIFRQPTPLVLRRDMDALQWIIVRLGPALPESPGGVAEGAQIEAMFFSDDSTVGDADRQVAASGGSAARALRSLWRAAH